MHTAGAEVVQQETIHKDMVEAAPSPTVFVGAAGAVLPHRRRRDIGEAMLLQQADGLIALIIIEIARHDDERVLLCRPYGVDRLGHPLRHPDAVGIGLCRPAGPAGGVHRQHMQCVAPAHHSAGIEHIAGGMLASLGRDAQRRMADNPEGEGRIEQRHIDAPLIAALRDDVFIARLPQERPSGQVAYHRVVLHLAERHHVGQCPLCAVLFAAREHRAGHVVHLLPVFVTVPMTLRCRQKLIVVFQRVVLAVEEVLAVELHEGEKRSDEQQQLHGVGWIRFLRGRGVKSLSVEHEGVIGLFVYRVPHCGVSWPGIPACVLRRGFR